MVLSEEEIVAKILKILIDNGNDYCSAQFLRSQEVYCKNPWKLFNYHHPMALQNGRFFLVNRTADSGKTDGCKFGCWRVMRGDKLIKSEENEKMKILGFKKVFKFCEKEKMKPRVFDEQRMARDERIWVMEEYRLASKWKQDYVICKIRLLLPNPVLERLLCNHTGGIYVQRRRLGFSISL